MPTLTLQPVSHGMHRDQVLAAMSDAVWRALGGLPELGALPGVLFPELDRLVRTMAFGRLVSAGGPGDTERLVRFVGQGGFEGFQVDLAGTIVVRLEGRLGRRNYLELITRVIPAAVAGTLVEHPAADGGVRHETYRLAPGLAAPATGTAAAVPMGVPPSR